MSDHYSHVDVRPGSARSFGIVFTAVFSIIALWPVISGGAPRFVLLGVALVFLAVTLVKPKAWTIPNRLWFKLGMLLGMVVAPLAMMLVYFVVVCPMGLALRVFGKDPLRRKIDRQADTYWIVRDTDMLSMKSQF